MTCHAEPIRIACKRQVAKSALPFQLKVLPQSYITALLHDEILHMQKVKVCGRVTCMPKHVVFMLAHIHLFLPLSTHDLSLT